MKISQKQLDLEHSCSFISLRQIPKSQRLKLAVVACKKLQRVTLALGCVVQNCLSLPPVIGLFTAATYKESKAGDSRGGE